MNKSKSDAFLFFTNNHPPAVALVFSRLYHWGTISWKGHQAGDWFFKSANDLSKELGISLTITKKVYKIVKSGDCPFFESKIEKKRNYKITYFKVRNTDIHQVTERPSNNIYEVTERPTPGHLATRYQVTERPGINISTHINNSMSIRDARETPKVDDQQKVEVPNRQTDDSSKMVEIWNSIIRPCKPETMTDRRELQCLEVLRDHFNNDLDNWRQHCIRITQSSYLMGDKFTLHLSWALKPEWIQVVRSGRYDDEAWRLEKKAKEESSRQSLTQRPVITIDEALSDCTNEVDRKVKEILFRKLGPVTYAAWIKGRAFEMKGDQICITSCGDYTRKRIEQDFGDQLKQAYAAVYASLSDCKSSLIDHREGIDVDLLIYGNKPLTLSGDVLWAK